MIDTKPTGTMRVPEFAPFHSPGSALWAIRNDFRNPSKPLNPAISPMGARRYPPNTPGLKAKPSRARGMGLLATPFTRNTSERISYTTSMVDQAPTGTDNATVALQTLRGELLLQGNGQWVGGQLRFRGDAQAAPGREEALANLLNIIGRRQGPRSLLHIG